MPLAYLPVGRGANRLDETVERRGALGAGQLADGRRDRARRHRPPLGSHVTHRPSRGNRLDPQTGTALGPAPLPAPNGAPAYLRDAGPDHGPVWARLPARPSHHVDRPAE